MSAPPLEPAEKEGEFVRREERSLRKTAPTGAFRSATAAESGGTWRGDNPGGVSQGELPQSGKRRWPGPFVFNDKFYEAF